MESQQRIHAVIKLDHELFFCDCSASAAEGVHSDQLCILVEIYFHVPFYDLGQKIASAFRT